MLQLQGQQEREKEKELQSIIWRQGTGKHCPSLGLYCTVMMRPLCVPSLEAFTLLPNSDRPSKCSPSKEIVPSPDANQRGNTGSLPVRAKVTSTSLRYVAFSSARTPLASDAGRFSMSFSWNNFTKCTKLNLQCCGFLREPSGAYLKHVAWCSCKCPLNAQMPRRSSAKRSA